MSPTICATKKRGFWWNNFCVEKWRFRLPENTFGITKMLKIKCKNPHYKVIAGVMLCFLLFAELFLLLLSPMLVLPTYEQQIVLDKPILAKPVGVIGKFTPIHLRHNGQKYHFICNHLHDDNGDNPCYAITGSQFVQLKGWITEPSWLPQAYSREIILVQMSLITPNHQPKIYRNHNGIDLALSRLLFEKYLIQAMILLFFLALAMKLMKVKITFKSG